MKKTKLSLEDLSRRERQVVHIFAQNDKVTARDVERLLPNAPTYSAVRSILRILTEKGWITKTSEHNRDVYRLKKSTASNRDGLLKSIVNNFFSRSACDAACALLGDKNTKLSDEEADRLIKLIEEAKEKWLRYFPT